MKLPVPCNIITGSLGAGKTTLINKLLAGKPEHEIWAVIVNEFGTLGIDGALMEGSAAGNKPGVVIRQLAGGCLCCQAAGMLVPAVAQLLRQTKPDRLLIEPSGLGHPTGLVQSLQSEHLGPSIQLQAIICLVDVRGACQDQGVRSPLAEDQINVADVVLGSKADLASEGDLEAFHVWAEALWPPKAKVLVCSQSDAPPWQELLDTPRAPVYAPLLNTSSHASSSRRRQQQAARQPTTAPSPAGGGASQQGDEAQQPEEVALDGQEVVQGPSPGQPTRYKTRGSPDHVACGWLWHPGDIFKEQEVQGLLERVRTNQHVVRFKGVFRVSAKRWVYVNWTPGLMAGTADVLLQPTAYMTDSRFEVILDVGTQLSASSGAGEVEAMLNAEWGGDDPAS